MRFTFVLLATAFSSYFALLLMPWWIPMLIAFLLILMLPMKKWSSFLAPALGAGICFLLLTIFQDIKNDHLLSTKIAEIFHLPSFILLIIITGIIGFITAGLGGWTAAQLIALLKPVRNEEEPGEDGQVGGATS